MPGGPTEEDLIAPLFFDAKVASFHDSYLLANPTERRNVATIKQPVRTILHY